MVGVGEVSVDEEAFRERVTMMEDHFHGDETGFATLR